MKNIVKPVACKILEVKRESLHEYTYRVETDIKPEHGQFLLLQAPQVYAVNYDFAFVRNVHATDHVEQRSFAGAGGPDDGGEFALFNGEIHAVQGLHLVLAPAEVLLQVVYGYDVHV